MKVLVTGGAGFIGANLCRSLAAESAIGQVVALDDLSTGRQGEPGRHRRRRARRGVDPRPGAPRHPLRRRRRGGPPGRAPVGPTIARRPHGDPRGQRRRHHGGARGGTPARTAPADRRLVLVGLRREPGTAQTGGHGDAAGQPLCGEQARRGVGLARLRPLFRPPGPRLPLLQRLRSAATRRSRLCGGGADLRRRRPPERAPPGARRRPPDP